jgi:hypothetical protein
MQLLTRSLGLTLSVLLLSSTQLATAGSDSSKPKTTEKPCTVRSPTTGSYFDLNAISLSPPELKDGRKIHKDDREESWKARGHDYPANFTFNICAPVIEDLKDVVGVDKSRWQNVSAFYERNGKTYSIGYDITDIGALENFDNRNTDYMQRAGFGTDFSRSTTCLELYQWVSLQQHDVEWEFVGLGRGRGR